jgi:hypothetical protein
MPEYLRTDIGDTGLWTANRRDFIRRLLPYGMYECKDGRQVLFDRHYAPICQRYPGQEPTLADPTEWVEGVAKWFYNDSTPNKWKVAVKVLEEWGMLEAVMQRAEEIERKSKVQRKKLLLIK